MHTLGRNSGQENAVLTVSLRGREGGATAELGDDVAGCLRASSGGGDKPHVLAPIALSCKDHGADAGELAPTLRAMGHGESHANAGGQVAVCVTGDITHTLKAEWFDASEDGTGRGQPIVAATGESYAGTTKSNTAEALRALREEIGAEAFTQWGLGVLDSLQSPEILRQGLHGCSVRCQACEGESGLDDGAPPCPQVGSGGGVCQMREAGRQRRSPQGRQLAEQLSRQLGADLSKLPPQGASAKVFLRDLWQASEGLWLLREALSALQEMGKSASNEAQPAQCSAVRRLTPRETERLQGFPDDWTLIPFGRVIRPEKLDVDFAKYLMRGGSMTFEQCLEAAADGPRYKAIGNSKAVFCVRWIARRIDNHLQRLNP